MEVKTTKKHFEIFKNEAGKWIRNFGLTDWDITFEHIKMEGIKAQCRYNLVNRTATLSLSTNYSNECIGFDIEYDVKKSAFHEVCELLLCPLETMVEQRYALGVDDVREETHCIVRRLENFVFKEAKE